MYQPLNPKPSTLTTKQLDTKHTTDIHIMDLVIHFSTICMEHIRIHTHTHTHTGWRRPIGCIICISQFPQKSSTISGSFVKNDMQLEVSYESSPPCMTHSSVWYDSFMRAMTHSYVYHDSFIYVTWLIRMCARKHSVVCHDSLFCVTWLMFNLTHSVVHGSCRTGTYTRSLSLALFHARYR